jgi:HD superfamily phosphohydrolase
MQLTIGSDRMDFIKRDAYFCGTLHLGTIASDRIIECSILAERDGIEYIHYKAKVVDDIYQALIGRFTLYKNMYWHKTVTAASLLIENMIELSVEPLNLIYKTKDPDSFIELTDAGLEEMVRYSHGSRMVDAKALLDRIHARDFPKMVLEELVSKKILTNYNNSNFREAINLYINANSGISTVNVPNHIPLYVTYQNPITTVQPDQFDKDKVYVLDSDKNSITFREQLQKTHYFASFCDVDETVIVRVYTDKQYEQKVKQLIKKNSLKVSSMNIYNTEQVDTSRDTGNT